MNTQPVREYLLGLQNRIVSTMQAEDGKTFLSDGWTRPAGGRLEGDGLSQLVEEGHLLERGGCNFSHVKGQGLPPSATQHRPELAGAPFEAMGVSLVFHPRNPQVPTVHMNVRMFAAHARRTSEPVVWFGGGMDLTPYYGFEARCRSISIALCRDALAPHGRRRCSRASSTWCDEYFFLKHRNEPRGVGGIFFDDYSLADSEGGFEAEPLPCLRSVGDAFPAGLSAHRGAPP